MRNASKVLASPKPITLSPFAMRKRAIYLKSLSLEIIAILLITLYSNISKIAICILKSQLFLCVVLNTCMGSMAYFSQTSLSQLSFLLQSLKACFISISGGDPEVFKGVDSNKLKANAKASDKAFEPFYKRMMASEIPWNVVAVPNKKWAMKVFPNVSEEEAMEKLWNAIFLAVRIDEGDAVEKWNAHNALLAEKCKKLNEMQFAKLHYKNSIGTDFIVGLAKNHHWEGGSEKDENGVEFVANMPTEEVFTMPDHRIGEGTVVSALPLSFEGTLIKNFRLTFRNGRIEEFSAEEGYEALERLLNSDEGSRHLGEVALVPYESPISNMNILFYNTLFDENASCHFAFGECYPTTIQGGNAMTEEELFEAGGNHSMNHVDFMIGTSDLSIIGIKEDGTKVPVFENGNFVL